MTYEVSLKIRTIKNSPVIRNRFNLPFPVKNDTRIGVICGEHSAEAAEARTAGAVIWGEESLFEIIRAKPNALPFNRLICHEDSVPKLNKAGLGRILGPKGLMPSLKTGTITRGVLSLIREMGGKEAYRERIGAIRLPIGNIQFTPKQLADNLKALITSVRGDITRLEDRVDKGLIEVVLTSTNGPGFSLNGGFLPTDESIAPEDLGTAM